MKTSLIITIKNEAPFLPELLSSILQQTVPPNEVIIVDGGSIDSSLQLLRLFKKTNRSLNLRILSKNGNRSIGRNEGIGQAKGDVILISDAGCSLDKNWTKFLKRNFNDPSVEVVAGYYAGKPKTVFQKCLVPYVLMMPEKVDKNTFLPATRSMAFRKEIWRKIGGFPKQFSHNEDYVFARQLTKAQANIVFEPNALVYWTPRKNLKEAFVMFFRFACGDAEAGIIRPKVVLIVARYSILLVLLLSLISSLSAVLAFSLCILFLIYIVWSINKNYRYVRSIHAFYLLPALQILSDIAVIAGTFFGSLSSLRLHNKFIL